MMDLCRHPRHETRRRVHNNGAVHVVEQCLGCGNLIRSIPKAEWLGRTNPAKLPAWDDDLPRQYQEGRSEAIRHGYEEQRQKESAEWWAWYNAYLRSPAWKAIRAKVLRRDNFTCQGCGATDAATQVHHLTYERAGREMMFDLVSVCDDCHEAIHADRKAVTR